jgi:hypothetical protein
MNGRYFAVLPGLDVTVEAGPRTARLRASTSMSRVMATLTPADLRLLATVLTQAAVHIETPGPEMTPTVDEFRKTVQP